MPLISKFPIKYFNLKFYTKMNFNKLTLTLCFVCAVIFSTNAQIKMPTPSPKGSAGSTVGLTDVTIEYYRPKKKDRKIFGSGDSFLVPYGKIWRTGANSGSKITFSTDVKIAGKDVKAGSYLIYTKPEANQWRFMLYSDLKLGGYVAKYDTKNEVLNIAVSPIKVSPVVETMTFNISDISADSRIANIYFAWDNVALKVPIKVSFDKEVMKSIKENTQVNPRNYTSAANYYLEAGKDLPQALKWMEIYLAQGENGKQFWHIHTKAKILAKMGKKKDAIATAKKSMELAKKSSGGDFGYIKRNEDLLKALK